MKWGGATAQSLPAASQRAFMPVHLVVGAVDAVVAAIHELFPHTIGVLAGLFGAGAVAVGVAEASNSTADQAANVGGAGLGFMDEQRLREKEAREEAEMAADRKKAEDKLKAGPGLLDPTNKSLTDVLETLAGNSGR